MPVASPSKHRMRVRYSEPLTRSGGLPSGHRHAPLGHLRGKTGRTGGHVATNKGPTAGDSSDASWDDAYAGEMSEVGEGNSDDSDAWTDEPTRAFEAVNDGGATGETNPAFDLARSFKQTKFYAQTDDGLLQFDERYTIALAKSKELLAFSTETVPQARLNVHEKLHSKLTSAAAALEGEKSKVIGPAATEIDLIQAASLMQVVYHELVQRVAAVKKRFEGNRVAVIKDIEAIRKEATIALENAAAKHATTSEELKKRLDRIKSDEKSGSSGGGGGAKGKQGKKKR
ncbi:hypothetical protein Rhopal_001690-T1 [Rhodotorula paludigena]|uniref:Uncharacterized protein n=1 Tax=Rhodotorula paludigena TaxID=86838 RepID=A0AAV5GFT4_9BASI|nr:hypothetical protein Rhopal_001690-T1 [Rhodotorula paludigena]